MTLQGHVVEHDHGPVVQVTIGISFAQEQRRQRREGTSGTARKTVRAPINLTLPTTLISRQLCEELGPYQRDLKYETRRNTIPLMGEALRSQTTMDATIEELQPDLLFKSTEVIILESLGDFQCVLGRNFLRLAALMFICDGATESFGFSTTEG